MRVEFGFPVQVSSAVGDVNLLCVMGRRKSLWENRRNGDRALCLFWEGKKSTDAASCCVLEGRWLSVGESSETIGSFSHNAVSCLQVLINVLAGYAAKMSCCVADRLCSVLLADSQIY